MLCTRHCFQGPKYQLAGSWQQPSCLSLSYNRQTEAQESWKTCEVVVRLGITPRSPATVRGLLAASLPPPCQDSPEGAAPSTGPQDAPELLDSGLSFMAGVQQVSVACNPRTRTDKPGLFTWFHPFCQRAGSVHKRCKGTGGLGTFQEGSQWSGHLAAARTC